MTFTPPAPADFLSRAKTDKIQLIDELAAQELAIGFEAAQASFAYYKVYLVDKNDVNVPMLRAEKERTDAQYDAVKHAISALQSTLKAERELLYDNNSEQ
jgi:hypothetical protein